MHRKYILFGIFPTRCNFAQFIYFGTSALHVSGGISTNHRSTYNCIYSIWYLLNNYCYLPLLLVSCNWFESDVGIEFICFGVVAGQQPHQTDQ